MTKDNDSPVSHLADDDSSSKSRKSSEERGSDSLGRTDSGDESPPAKRPRISNVSSLALVGAGKVDKILVLSQVTKTEEDDFRVKYYVNSGQRPDTELSEGGQGDHSTSYTAIIQAILSAADSTGIKYAVENLQSFGNSILQDKEEFKKIKKPRVHENEDRKKLIDFLETNDTFKDKAPVFNKELKYAKITQYAGHLAELTTCLLTGMQQEELATFHSQGRMGKAKDEGANAKSAARGLLAADKLCKLCSLDGEEFNKELKSFKASLKVKKKDSDTTEEDHVVRYGINAYYKDGGSKANEIEKTLDKDDTDLEFKKKALERLRDELLDKTEQNAKFLGDLLDYQRTIKFDLKEAISLTKTQKTGKTPDEQKEIRKDKLKKIFDEKTHQLEFKKETTNNDGKNTEIDVLEVTRDDLGSLTQILSRHLKIIKFAFPNLDLELKNQKKYDGVVDKFLEEEVCEKQGWKHAVYENKENMTDKNVDREFLRKKIDELVLDKSKTTSAHSR